MKSLLTILAIVSISAVASANCKSSMQSFVTKYKNVTADASDKCLAALNKNYDNDFAKKMAAAAACPTKVGALKALTEAKRAACTANCSDEPQVCETTIGLQEFYNRVNAL